MTDTPPGSAPPDGLELPEGVPPPPSTWRLRVVQVLTIAIVVAAKSVSKAILMYDSIGLYLSVSAD